MAEKQSWLDAYLKYTRLFDSPTRFHFWSAVTVASHALGKRVWLNRQGRWMTYPGQMMCILIGPSGVRKTTAIKQAKKVLVAARLKLPTDLCHRINVMSQRMSTEAVFDDIIPLDDRGMRMDPETVDCQGMLIAGEMAATFGNQSYVEGLSTVLLSLHDNEEGMYNAQKGAFEPGYLEMTFKKDGAEKRRWMNAGICMLTATTPTGLVEGLPPHIRTDGFLGRIVPVWESESMRPYNSMLGEPPEEDLEAPAELVDGLAALAELSGQAWLTKAAKALHEEWFPRKQCEFDRDTNAIRQAFYKRVEDHVHRTAIVLASVDAVAHGQRGHRDVKMDALHYQKAHQLIEACVKRLPECYAALQAHNGRGLREWLLYRLSERRTQNAKKGWYTWQAIQKLGLDPRVGAGEWKSRMIWEELHELSEMGRVEMVDAKQKKDFKFRLVKQVAGPWTGKPATVDRAFVATVNRQLAEDYEEEVDEWADEYAEMAAEAQRRDRGDDDAD